MRRNKRIFDMSKSELSKGIFTLGFGAAIGFAAAVYLFFTYAIIIVAIILIVVLIKYIITASRHKKIAPILEKIDNCESDEVFADITSEIMALAFKKGYFLKSSYYVGEKVLNFCFIKSDKLITHDDILRCLSRFNAKDKAIVTNSHLDKMALFSCKNYDIYVVDRDVLIEMLLYNLKHQ